MRQGNVLIQTVLVLILWTSVSFNSNGEEETKNVTPQEWSDRLRPEIEKICGATFTGVPRILTVSRQEFNQALNCAMNRQMELFMKDKYTAELAKRVEQRAAEAAQRLPAFYSFVEQTVYLCPETFAQTKQAANWDVLLPIMLAHELTHALQDQTCDFTTLFASFGQANQLVIFNFLTEGHAVYTQNKLAKNLNMTEAAKAIMKLLPGGLDVQQSILKRVKSSKEEKMATGLATFYYQYGPEYVERVISQKNVGVFWDQIFPVVQTNSAKD